MMASFRDIASIKESQRSQMSMKNPNQISFVINLEPAQDSSKTYKSALAIAGPSEENPWIKFSYFRFDQMPAGLNQLQTATATDSIAVPISIKGFLAENSPQGQILQIIDIDSKEDSGILHKYLVILMQTGFVFLNLIYHYEKGKPQISLLK